MASGTSDDPGAAAAATTGPSTAPAEPPLVWVDPDTGHRVHRLTTEPSSTGLYFNINAYTPDGKEMVYTTPAGLHVLELATGKSRQVVASNGARAIAIGKKTRTIFFTRKDDRGVYGVNIDTGEIKTLATLPARASVASINADETLAAGTYIEGTGGEDYGAQRINPPGQSGPLVQPLNKAKMMEDRFAAKLPMVLFTIDLRNGQIKELLHSTDWINHLLFSPADPALLMYCHEGPWHKLDRIWTIHTDGTQNQLMHKRTMAMEIAGHEFWGLDGRTIWYDLQTPKGEDFWLASYDFDTGRRRWYHMLRNEWSIHFNVTNDESLFCGDGGDPGQVAKAPDGQWIELFYPELISVTGENEKSFTQPGVFHSERLVNMSKHDYKLEPNVRFSPDNRMVIFTSNMFGPSYVFGVEVEKAK
jgi:oligogalacturonide lyase